MRTALFLRFMGRPVEINWSYWANTYLCIEEREVILKGIKRVNAEFRMDGLSRTSGQSFMYNIDDLRWNWEGISPRMLYEPLEFFTHKSWGYPLIEYIQVRDWQRIELKGNQRICGESGRVVLRQRLDLLWLYCMAQLAWVPNGLPFFLFLVFLCPHTFCELFVGFITALFQMWTSVYPHMGSKYLSSEA